MKLYRYAGILAMMVIMSFASAVHADNFSNTIAEFKKSPAVQPFFKNAYGYAVFPTVGKGGIGIGGAYGKGQVYRQGAVTGKVSLTKVTIGFQLGGQAFSEIIFFQDGRAYKDFTSGEFEFDAAASAVAITAGAQAKAGTEGASASAGTGSRSGAQAKTSYRKGMAVFTYIKGGLMYEAAVGGQKFNFKAK
jgi:lipid-binding SYLF domain-containing protein